MISEERYIELESSYVYSKAILEVLKEDDLTTLDFWDLKGAEETSER